MWRSMYSAFGGNDEKLSKEDSAFKCKVCGLRFNGRKNAHNHINESYGLNLATGFEAMSEKEFEKLEEKFLVELWL